MIAVTGGPTPLSAVQMYVPASGKMYVPASGKMYVQASGKMYIPASGKMYVEACGKKYVQASGNMIGNDYHAVVFACQNSINFNKNYHSSVLLGILRHFFNFSTDFDKIIKILVWSLWKKFWK